MNCKNHCDHKSIGSGEFKNTYSTVLLRLHQKIIHQSYGKYFYLHFPLHITSLDVQYSVLCKILPVDSIPTGNIPDRNLVCGTLTK